MVMELSSSSRFPLDTTLLLINIAIILLTVLSNWCTKVKNYIQGGPSGLRQKPSQIILASDIPGPAISTLGYSLAGGLDMDFNNHTDLLVGAYESDTVVILRSRPVIDIVTWFGNKTVRINPSKLGCDMDPTSEEVCFQVNISPHT